MIARGRPVLAAVLSLLAGLLLWATVAVAAPTFPSLTGRVVDDASILSPQTKAALTAKLEALETKTSRQLVIVTVPSLQGYEIEDYGYQLGRAWGIGEKGRDTGALLIVAPKERRVRVEVGYGLEPVLTDALSSVILQRTILPRFRAGDIEGGVVAGADGLIAQLSLPDAEAKAQVAAAAPTPATGGSVPPIVVVVLGVWVLLGLVGMLTGRRGHRMDLWLLPLLLLMGGSGHGGGRRSGGFRGGGGSFGGGGASGGW